MLFDAVDSSFRKKGKKTGKSLHLSMKMQKLAKRAPIRKLMENPSIEK